MTTDYWEDRAERAEATLDAVRAWAEEHAQRGDWWRAPEVGRTVLAILDHEEGAMNP